MRNYIGLIHKDADSDFGVSFPDIPDVVTAGTLDDARAMAEQALAVHMDSLAEDGEAIPEPSSLEEVISDRITGAAWLFLFRHGFTRSELLTQAAKKLTGEAA